MTSSQSLKVWASTRSRVGRRNEAELYVGMTTDTRGPGSLNDLVSPSASAMTGGRSALSQVVHQPSGGAGGEGHERERRVLLGARREAAGVGDGEVRDVERSVPLIQDPVLA